MRPAHKTHERVTGEMSQEQELRHQEVLEPLPVAIYPTDIAGRITYSSQTNAALFFGVRAAPPRNEVRWPLFCPDETVLPYADCPRADTLREERPAWDQEFAAKRPSGGRVHLMGYSKSLFDGIGRSSGGVDALN
jgi:PAS domain-containing protein